MRYMGNWVTLGAALLRACVKLNLRAVEVSYMYIAGSFIKHVSCGHIGQGRGKAPASLHILVARSLARSDVAIRSAAGYDHRVLPRNFSRCKFSSKIINYLHT